MTWSAICEAGKAQQRAEGARIEELLAPETTAVRVLQTAHRALLAVERGLDAWDAGARPDGFIGAAACAVASLAEVAVALDAASVALPGELVSAAQVLAGFASAACPAPVLDAVAP